MNFSRLFMFFGIFIGFIFLGAGIIPVSAEEENIFSGFDHSDINLLKPPVDSGENIPGLVDYPLPETISYPSEKIQNTDKTYFPLAATGLKTQGNVILVPITPTPEGSGYSYYNPSGNDSGYVINSPGMYTLGTGFSTTNYSAIKIVSPEVFLDGNGQIITGTQNNHGVRFIPGASDGAVHNFTGINNFTWGITSESDNITIENNLMRYNNNWGIASIGDNATISNNSANENNNGIAIDGLYSLVRDNTANNNEQCGIAMRGDYGNLLGNIANDNDRYGFVCGAGWHQNGTSFGGYYSNIGENSANNNTQIGLWSIVPHVQIHDNNVSNSANNGIVIAGDQTDVIRNNVYSNYNTGINAIGNGSTIFDNIVNNNIYGVVISQGSDFVLSGNQVTNNSQGIWVNGSGHHLTQNNASYNLENGIHTDQQSYNNSIFGNTAINNSWGINSWGENQIILSNSLSKNNHWGIYSQGTNITLVGNNAVDNWMGLGGDIDNGAISLNTVFKNKHGISNTGNYTLINDNSVSNNTWLGLFFIGRNVTILNNTATCNDEGIGFDYSENVEIFNNFISENGNVGLYVDGNNSRISNNVIHQNNLTGLYIHDHNQDMYISNNIICNNPFSFAFHESGGNGSGAIYNNHFGNYQDQNYGAGNASYYLWTNPAGPQPGTNVMGGPNIAGNYWSNPNGTGWSDLQPGNSKGYTTTPFEVAPGTIDTAPLVQVNSSVFHTINATSGLGGSIDPSGLVQVPHGGNQSFTFTPDTGYVVNNLMVDGQPTLNVSPFSFLNVVSNHTIAIDFKPQSGPVNPWEINFTRRFTDQWSEERGYGWKTDDGTNWSYQIGAYRGILQNYSGPTSFYMINGFTTGASMGIYLNQSSVSVDINLSEGQALMSTANLSHMIQVNKGLVTLNSGILNTTTNVRNNFASGIELTSSDAYAVMNGGEITGYYGGMILRNGTAVVNNGEIQAEYGIHVLDGSATLNDGNIAGYEGMRMNNGSIGIHGGSLSGRDGIIMWGGNLTISDGTLRGISQAINSYGINVMGGSVTITGGDIMGRSGIAVCGEATQTNPNILIQSLAQINGSSYGIQYGQLASNSPNAVSWKTYLSNPDIIAGGSSKIHVEANSPGNSISYPGVTITTGNGITPEYPVQVDLSMIPGNADNLSDIRIYDEDGVVCFDGTTNTTKITMPVWDGNQTHPLTFNASTFEIFTVEKTKHSAYIINATAGFGGIITPSGLVNVTAGHNQTFSITPKPGATITDVQVDEWSMGPIDNWTFTNLSEDHSIHAMSNPTPGQIHVVFSATPRYGEMPLFVSFNSSETLGEPTSWFWQFGDGKTSNESNPQHTYSIPGSYSVTLRALNNQTGGYAQWNRFITVTDGPVPEPTPTPVPGEITPQFTADPETGFVPLSVQFTDESSGNPTEWFWEFGDGEISTERNPIHIYMESGSFPVKLFARNSFYSARITVPDKIVVL